MIAVEGNDSGESLVVLVTGGSTGIGAATVEGLLARGHRVVATGRDEGRLDLLAKRLDDERLVTSSGDGTDQADVEAAVRVATDTFGGLDVVVANAGFSTHDTLADGDPGAWRDMVLINVLGPMLLIRAALPALRRSKAPRVVLLGSVAGVKNSPGNVYSVTKWAVTGLAENARMLLTRDGIGVTMVAPGRVDTPFWDTSPDLRAAREAPVLSPEAIAGSIVWAIGQPAGVDVNTVVVRPLGQTG